MYGSGEDEIGADGDDGIDDEDTDGDTWWWWR